MNPANEGAVVSESGRLDGLGGFSLRRRVSFYRGGIVSNAAETSAFLLNVEINRFTGRQSCGRKPSRSVRFDEPVVACRPFGCSIGRSRGGRARGRQSGNP